MNSQHTKLIDLAESLVSYGKKKGASQVEVAIGEGTRFRVRVREGEVETLTEAGSKGLRLRLFVGDKVANASSSDFSKTALTRLIDNGIERAKLGGSDSFSGLPKAEEVAATDDKLGLFDPAIVEMPPEKKIDYAKKLEVIALKDDRVMSIGSTFGTTVQSRVLVNSNGFSGAFQRTSFTTGVGLQAGAGDNLFQDGWFDGGTSLAGLDEPEIIARIAVDRVTRLMGARKVESQDVPVVIEPNVTATLLLGLLARCVNGERVARNQSFLVDRLGSKVASDKVTIIDDGLLKGGLGTAPFDDEGVPTRTTPVIKRGVLKSYLLDTYYGRKLGVGSTGNAGGTNNFYLKAGDKTPQEIIRSVDKGLLLTGTLGLGSDPTTGDISIGAFGLWIEEGRTVFPVAEITISGNLETMLAGIEMVGTDLVMRNSTNGPTVKVAEMTVGGTTAG